MLEQEPFTSTCDLLDALGQQAQPLLGPWRIVGGRIAFAGEAVTVKCFEDNSRIKEASAQPGHGKVLVVDAGGSERCALVGDMIGADLVAQGWVGVVVDGCVRDSAALAQLPLGVVARGVVPRKSERKGEGQRDLPVVIGGARITSGDRIVADEDGVIVIPKSTA
jgi:regulator of ribonuclease activity A